MGIGACAVFPKNETTINTFKNFEKCFPELSKEQRIVKFIIIEALLRIMGDLERVLWTKLSTKL